MGLKSLLPFSGFAFLFWIDVHMLNIAIGPCFPCLFDRLLALTHTF
jgi:hypothetical protein